LCLLKCYTALILASKVYIFECISRTIKVINVELVCYNEPEVCCHGKELNFRARNSQCA
jgi:hypothetical protein